MMKLPDKRTKANPNPLAYSVYLYGEPKTGKTTWAAQNPDALFLATEPGTEALDVYQLPIKKWAELQEALKLLQKQPDKYPVVVVDTIDLAYELCAKHYVATAGIEHLSDLDYGKGYGAVKDMFWHWVQDLCKLPMQVILIGHCKYRDKTKTTPAKYVPSIAAGGEAVVCGLVDSIVFVEAASAGSVAHCQSGRTWNAGSRVSGMPVKLPMDYSAFMESLSKAVKSQRGKAKAAPANTDSTLEMAEEDDDDPFAV